MWQLIDQFIYVSILLITGLEFIYRKSQYLAALILLIVLILSNTIVFSVLLAPAIFFLVIWTIVKTIKANSYIFKQLKQKTIAWQDINLYELLWALIGVGLVIVTLVEIYNLSLFQVIESFRKYDTWLSIYLLIILIKFISSYILKLELVTGFDVQETMANSSQNHEINSLQMATNTQESEFIEMDDKELTNYNNKQEKTVRERKSNGVDTSKKQSINNLPFLLLTLAVLIAGLTYFLINRNVYDYDITEHSLVIYDHESYNPELSIISAEQEFRTDGDYSKLYNKYEDYGYSKEQLDSIFTDLNSELIERLKKIELSYELSISNVSYGDEVTITTNYNQDKAKKEKIKIVNPTYTYVVDDINELASSTNTSKNDLSSLLEEVETKLKADKISYDTIEVASAYLDETKKDGSRKLIVEYELDNGKYKALIGTREVDNVYLTTEIFYENDHLKHTDNFKVSRNEPKINEEYVELK